MEYLEESDLPEHFRIVSELCGIDLAKTLIERLGGTSISIPKPTRIESIVIKYVKDNKDKCDKRLATELELSERTIKRLTKKLGRNRQDEKLF